MRSPPLSSLITHVSVSPGLCTHWGTVSGRRRGERRRMRGQQIVKIALFVSAWPVPVWEGGVPMSPAVSGVLVSR